MREPTVSMMLDHVRAIHRAVTGGDPPDGGGAHADPGVTPTASAVAWRFAELESLVRSIPALAERVPPFSFTPPADIIAVEREIIVELGVPGSDAQHVHAELQGGAVVISGMRVRDTGEARVWLHAELPCGPFSRRVELPLPVAGAPRIEVDRGVVRVRLAKRPKSSLPQA